MLYIDEKTNNMPICIKTLVLMTKPNTGIPIIKFTILRVSVNDKVDVKKIIILLLV